MIVTVFQRVAHMTRRELAEYLDGIVEEDCTRCPAAEYCRRTGLMWTADECRFKIAEYLNSEIAEEDKQ